MASVNGTISSLVRFKAVTAQLDRQQKSFERQPLVKRAIEYFNEKAPDIKSVDDLLKDRRLTEFVLGAFQLEEKVDAKGLLRKLLSEDPADQKSLANRLSDPRYRQLAAALTGLKNGTAIFSNANARSGLISAYKTNQFEKYQGEQTPGLREAFYFKRQIGSADNIFQVIGSEPLAKVVRVALGLPKEFSGLPAKQQAKFLENRFDLEKIKEPRELNKFIDRFLANNDSLNSTGSGIADLFAPSNGLGIQLGAQGLVI